MTTTHHIFPRLRRWAASRRPLLIGIAILAVLLAALILISLARG